MSPARWAAQGEVAGLPTLLLSLLPIPVLFLVLSVSHLLLGYSLCFHLCVFPLSLLLFLPHSFSLVFLSTSLNSCF